MWRFVTNVSEFVAGRSQFSISLVWSLVSLAATHRYWLANWEK